MINNDQISRLASIYLIFDFNDTGLFWSAKPSRQDTARLSPLITYSGACQEFAPDKIKPITVKKIVIGAQMIEYALSLRMSRFSPVKKWVFACRPFLVYLLVVVGDEASGAERRELN